MQLFPIFPSFNFRSSTLIIYFNFWNILKKKDFKLITTCKLEKSIKFHTETIENTQKQTSTSGLKAPKLLY